MLIRKYMPQHSYFKRVTVHCSHWMHLILFTIEGKDMTKENLDNAAMKGNIKGAKATEFYGAIQL